jgi:hypothetical protein
MLHRVMHQILFLIDFPMVSGLQVSVDSNNVWCSSDRIGPMKAEVQPRRKRTYRKRTPRPRRNDRPEQVCLSSGYSNKQSSVFVCWLVLETWIRYRMKVGSQWIVTQLLHFHC